MRLLFQLVAAAALIATCGVVHPAELKAMDAAPPAALELRDLSGHVHRLADYRGQVVLINFWATWCEPCRDEMPSIARLRTRFVDRPFTVLAVNVDEPEARIEKFLAAMPLNFPILVDQGRKATNGWKVRVLPASFVIGPNGRVRYAVSGELDWNAPAVAERIRKLLPPR